LGGFPLGDNGNNVFEQQSTIDLSRISEGVKLILEGLGEDPNREGLAETPHRVAKMYKELCQPEQFNATSFLNQEQYDQIVMVRNIPFFSLCEHHMIPFFGTATVGYIPQKEYLGLSKLARAVQYYSRRLQVQERLTTQVAEWLMEFAKPLGVGVIITARHLCMEMRGVQKIGNDTVSSAMLGVFRESQAARQEFLCLTQL
jgi:GTP cyclohydrolase I